MFPKAHLEHYFDLYSFRINFDLQYYLLSFYIVIKVNQKVANCRFLLVLKEEKKKKKKVAMTRKEKQE